MRGLEEGCAASGTAKPTAAAAAAAAAAFRGRRWRGVPLTWMAAGKRRGAAQAHEATGAAAAAAPGAWKRVKARDGGAEREEDAAKGTHLYSLPAGRIVEGVLVKRPSVSIRSPYVADVRIGSRTVMAHCPSLDLGGLCVPGASLLLTVNENAAVSLSELLRADDEEAGTEQALRAKTGQTKTSVSVQLVRCEEPESGTGGCWIGAHPSLGEKLALSVIEKLPWTVLGGACSPAGRRVAAVKKQVTLATKGGRKMRADYVLDVADGGRTTRLVVEVKNVVCADYKPDTKPDRKDCVFVSDRRPYERAAIFPWGSVKQVFEGKKVVSTRACEHIRTLASIAQGGLPDGEYASTEAVLLLLVNRGDAKYARPCFEACPVRPPVRPRACLPRRRSSRHAPPRDPDAHRRPARPLQTWAAEVESAISKGVRVIAVGVAWEGHEAKFNGVLPFTLRTS